MRISINNNNALFILQNSYASRPKMNGFDIHFKKNHFLIGSSIE